ncbi:MAG: hypothetical protein QOG98_264 [Pseudonocardiales bacterium]|nr:hypothetical protein [Pseudonocardiales bacterium]
MHPSIQVSVALSTLLGLDEQPGELAGAGPSPPRSPADSPRTRPGPGGGSSPTRWAAWLITAAPPTAHRRTWPITSSPETAPAASRTANAKPAAASSTTSNPGTATAKPTNPTCSRSAVDTIIPSTTPAGHHDDSTTAPSNGPARPDTPTSKNQRPTRSITPLIPRLPNQSTLSVARIPRRSDQFG